MLVLFCFLMFFLRKILSSYQTGAIIYHCYYNKFVADFFSQLRDFLNHFQMYARIYMTLYSPEHE